MALVAVVAMVLTGGYFSIMSSIITIIQCRMLSGVTFVVVEAGRSTLAAKKSTYIRSN